MEYIEPSTLDLIPKFIQHLPQKINTEDVNEFEIFLSKIMVQYVIYIEKQTGLLISFKIFQTRNSKN